MCGLLRNLLTSKCIVFKNQGYSKSEILKVNPSIPKTVFVFSTLFKSILVFQCLNIY